MTYNFKNNKTGEIIEKKYCMTDDIPTSFEEEGATFTRDYVSEGDSKGIVIPENMKSSATKRIMQGNRKSPSGRQHFF